MPAAPKGRTYLIFVTSTTSGAGGEKICHVEKFFHMTDCHVEKLLHMRNLSHRESSPHDKCGAKRVMWRNPFISFH